MSTNLYLSEGEEGPEISLWHTPTWITDLCLSYDKNGVPDGGMEGVMRRYEIWVRSYQNGVWKTKEDLDAMCERVNAHLKEIQTVKDPFFWGF